MNLKKVNEEIRDCHKCKLYEHRVNQFDLERGFGKLYGKYNSNEVMFVGLNPSYRRFPKLVYAFGGGENVGGTGDKFVDLLKKITLFKRCYLTNLIKCSTENNTINKIQLASCSCWIEKEIEEVKPKIIVALGNEVCEYFNVKLNSAVFDKNRNTNIVGMYHPNYIFSYEPSEEKLERYVSYLEDILSSCLEDFPQICVFFEGCDGSGKSTVRKKFAQLTNERCYTADRFVISNIVFDSYFKRNNLDKFYYKVIDSLFKNKSFNSFIVYLYAREEILKIRRQGTTDENLDFSFIHELFTTILTEFKDENKMISIDTSDLTVDEAAYKIIDEIEGINNE